MKILSHRGYWLSPAEKNTRTAMERSFRDGYGTETDLRDCLGELVVAHDPPRQRDYPADELLALHRSLGPDLPLALNIKADGLQPLLLAAIERHALRHAFVFDMSVPDTLHWLRAGVPVFVRHSDVEPEPVCYAGAAGIWLDAFHGDWWDVDVVRRHLDRGKKVCVVSPELHKREHRRVWERLLHRDLLANEALMLCTDHPGEASGVFK